MNTEQVQPGEERKEGETPKAENDGEEERRTMEGNERGQHLV